MPQLDPTTFTTQLFWLFVTFTALFFVVWRVALPRITEVREARRKRVDDDLDKASTMKSEAETVLEAYEKALADAAGTAQEQHRKAAAELADERTRRQEELAESLSEKVREAEQRIAGERQQAVDNIRDATLDVVQSATERLIGSAASEKEADDALGEALQESRS